MRVTLPLILAALAAAVLALTVATLRGLGPARAPTAAIRPPPAVVADRPAPARAASLASPPPLVAAAPAVGRAVAAVVVVAPPAVAPPPPVIETARTALVAAVGSCVDAARARRPTITGRLAIDARVAVSAGRLRVVRADAGGVDDPVLIACVTAAAPTAVATTDAPDGTRGLTAFVDLR